ncbi:hypothetical protein T07_11195 [Trichinella nelsoni]|uniref:Uncharacterized protein n=1 Tax=Trichinella nelsoni TaxID=6336 RepID=A0A0V0RS44_9BILA|nr:hypothetical protein T07_11195 [Trichinella nelsoni]
MDESKKAKKMPWSAEDQLRKMISARGKQHLPATWSMLGRGTLLLLTPTQEMQQKNMKKEKTSNKSFSPR